MSSRGTSPHQEFTAFPKLPAELRRKIWRLCLPYRVDERDRPAADCIFARGKAPCALVTSTYFNQRPPLITRVCFESREVAFEEGSFDIDDCDPDIPKDFEWEARNSIITEEAWTDAHRTPFVHLNWEAGYEAFYEGRDNRSEQPLRNLEHFVGRYGNCGSVMADYLVPLGYDMVSLLNRRSKWMVVVDTVVTHASARTAASLGLYGLLGDAPVQIVGLTEHERIDAYYTLAEQCEHGATTNPSRQSVRRSGEKLEQGLKRLVTSGELTASLCPAVIFRLCPFKCNQPTRTLPSRWTDKMD